MNQAAATHPDRHIHIVPAAGKRGPSERYQLLMHSTPAELEALLRRGETPDAERLAGHTYRGYNTPGFAKYIGIQKFTKGFFAREGGVSGYNLPTQQNRLHEEWIGKPDDATAKRFGFYAVGPVDPAARDNEYLNALLLDYSKGENSPYDPTRGLRDYLVRIDRGSDDLLVGKAYFAVGPTRLHVSYLLMERRD